MKRIVIILGGKGGTGKTAFTRLLLDVMGVTVPIRENSTLRKFQVPETMIFRSN